MNAENISFHLVQFCLFNNYRLTGCKNKKSCGSYEILSSYLMHFLNRVCFLEFYLLIIGISFCYAPVRNVLLLRAPAVIT